MKFNGESLTRFILFVLVFLAFTGWLVLSVTKIPDLADDPSSVDVLTAWGLGGVTTFFMNLVILAWQFYFRKAKGNKDDSAG
jgi:hypothetical protein